MTTASGTSPPTTSPTPGSPGTTAAPETPSTTAGPASSYRVVGRADDPAGDHGPEGPAHADLVGLTVERDATSMRVTVQMAGELPAALPAGQVQGVGVDLYRGAAVESAYQLFVDGGSDGWRAYLQVGTTFVDYPGEFRVGGTRLELTVPLDAFATGEPEAATAFADWSAERPVLNAASEDDLPALGRVPLSG